MPTVVGEDRTFFRLKIVVFIKIFRMIIKFYEVRRTSVLALRIFFQRNIRVFIKLESKPEQTVRESKKTSTKSRFFLRHTVRKTFVDIDRQ